VGDVRVPLPKSRLDVRYARSGGPGGQNVNKVETKVELRLRLEDLDVPAAVRDRIAARLASRMTADGALLVSSSRHRVRSQNLKDALERLQHLLDEAARPPVPRFATKPTRASQSKRREDKRRHGMRKRDRGRRGDGED
jgi:ribosome-associated protein